MCLSNFNSQICQPFNKSKSMKKNLLFIVLVFSAFTTALISSCKKDDNSSTNNNTNNSGQPVSQAQITQHSKDENSYKSESDNADNDINNSISNTSFARLGAGNQSL